MWTLTNIYSHMWTLLLIFYLLSCVDIFIDLLSKLYVDTYIRLDIIVIGVFTCKIRLYIN